MIGEIFFDNLLVDKCMIVLKLGHNIEVIAPSWPLLKNEILSERWWWRQWSNDHRAYHEITKVGVLPRIDPVPPNISQYRRLLTEYHHISMSLIVPLDNCSWWQLFLRSFTNGHLQRGRSSGWPKSRGRRSADCCKWLSEWSSLFCAPPFLCKWSFAKRMVLRMTKVKELLQMIIRRIRPPPFLCKWSFSKRTWWSVLLRPPQFLSWSFAKRTVLRLTNIVLVGWGWNSHQTCP